MKALIIIDSDAAFKLVSFYLKPLGFEFIRYRLPLKAMDNIDEVDPDAVLISAEDFPRHWKTVVQFIRSERSKTKTTIVILKGEHFTYEDAAKATHLGVNGIASEDFGDPEEIDRIQSILARYSSVKNDRAARRVRPADWDRLEFILSAPDSGSISTGRIVSISATGLAFEPEEKLAVVRFNPGTEFPDCALRIDDSIVSISCKLVRTEPDIAFSFHEMEEADRITLERYLAERPLRERRILG